MFQIAPIPQPGYSSIQSVGQVVQQLSLQLKKSIYVSKQLKPAMVFIRPNGGSPEALLKLIAVAVGGRLVENDGGYQLARSAQDLRDLRQMRADERKQWILRRIDGIAAYRRKVQVSGDLASSYLNALRERRSGDLKFRQGLVTEANPYFPADALPIQELLEGLVKRIGVEGLATLPSNKIQVYEDEPGLGAHLLPEHSDLLSSFYASMNKKLTQFSPEDQRLAESVFEPDNLRALSHPQEIRKLRLEVFPDQNGINFTLECFDPMGHCVQSKWMVAGPKDVRMVPALFVRASEKKPDTKWVQLSAEANKIIRFVQGVENQPIPPWFVHPDQREPLNLFVREAVQALTRTSTVSPTVMEVSDGLWKSVRECTKEGSLNLDALEATIQVWDPYIWIKTKEGMVARPLDLEADEECRASRQALASFAKQLTISNRVTLPSLCSLYHDSAPGIAPLANVWYLFSTVSNPSNSFRTDVSTRFYKLLGAVSERDWEDLKSGADRKCHDLGIEPDLFDALKSDPSLRVKGQDAPLPDLMRHPWEGLPNGLSGDVHLSFRQNNRLMVKIPVGRTFAWTPGELLANRYHLTFEDFVQQNGEVSLNISRDQFESRFSNAPLTLGLEVDWQARLWLTRNSFIEANIAGSTSATSEVISYSEFPQNIRDQVWKQAVEEGLQNYKIRTGMVPVTATTVGSGNVPPPAKP